ncbi:MAG: dihydroorotate dehydrogenase-like protein [Bacteroidota bacterium]
MADLKTKFLGLELKNPVIVSSSGLTNSVDKIKRIEDNGAGAVVLKSLFEEQIRFETGKLASSSDYPEAEDYIRNYVKSSSIEEYLNLIESAKKETNLPIIASVNCVSAREWVDFSRQMVEAGADALEINVFYLPTKRESSSDVFKNIYFELADKLKNTVDIPLLFKLGNNFTNLIEMANQLFFRGVHGVTLFNRFYEPDIDIENQKMVSAEVFSSPADIRQSLRWVGIISGTIPELEVAASTGIHDAVGVIKQLLAGASVTQLCSVLYKKGPEYLNEVLSGLESWMNKNNYATIADFRGKMNYSSIADPAQYERSQFMKYFSNYS